MTTSWSPPQSKCDSLEIWDCASWKKSDSESTDGSLDAHTLNMPPNLQETTATVILAVSFLVKVHKWVSSSIVGPLADQATVVVLPIEPSVDLGHGLGRTQCCLPRVCGVCVYVWQADVVV